jgi:hypothetical protein
MMAPAPASILSPLAELSAFSHGINKLCAVEHTRSLRPLRSTIFGPGPLHLTLVPWPTIVGAIFGVRSFGNSRGLLASSLGEL